MRQESASTMAKPISSALRDARNDFQRDQKNFLRGPEPQEWSTFEPQLKKMRTRCAAFVTPARWTLRLSKLVQELAPNAAWRWSQWTSSPNNHPIPNTIPCA